VKIKAWFKSQKNQATTYHKNHGQTGASGGKIEATHVKLRQDLYSTNPAVVKADLRQSRLPPAGGLDKEQPEVRAELSWEYYGVNTVVDTRDSGANQAGILDIEDEESLNPGEDGWDQEYETGGDGGYSDGNDDQGDEEEYEETTDGGGSSRAGVPVASRGSTSRDSSGSSSGGGGGVVAGFLPGRPRRHFPAYRATPRGKGRPTRAAVTKRKARTKTSTTSSCRIRRAHARFRLNAAATGSPLVRKVVFRERWRMRARIGKLKTPCWRRS